MAAQLTILTDPDCAGHRIMDLLANKWTIHILEILLPQVKRYNQIRRELPGISHKMLSQTLKALEQQRLIKRDLFPVVPPHVEYSLTSLGQELFAQLMNVAQWAEDHATELGCRPVSMGSGPTLLT